MRLTYSDSKLVKPASNRCLNVRFPYTTFRQTSPHYPLFASAVRCARHACSHDNERNRLRVNETNFFPPPAVDRFVFYRSTVAYGGDVTRVRSRHFDHSSPVTKPEVTFTCNQFVTILYLHSRCRNAC